MKTTAEQRVGRIRVLESWDQDGERRLTDGFERDLIDDVDEAARLVEGLKDEHSNWTIMWHRQEAHAGTVTGCDNHWCKKRCADQFAAATFLKEPSG